MMQAVLEVFENAEVGEVADGPPALQLVNTPDVLPSSEPRPPVNIPVAEPVVADNGGADGK